LKTFFLTTEHTENTEKIKNEEEKIQVFFLIFFCVFRVFRGLSLLIFQIQFIIAGNLFQ